MNNGRSTLLSAVLFLSIPLLARNAAADQPYTFDIIAQVGQGSPQLTGFRDGASINDLGFVAFTGLYSDGSGLFRGDGLSDPFNLNPSYSHSSARTFSRGMQLTNDNRIVAYERWTALSPVGTYVRTWTDSGFTTLARGGGAGTPPDYDVLNDYPSINNLGQTVFSGTTNSVTYLTTPGISGFNTVSFTGSFALKPMIADDGSIVARAGQNAASPIVLYDYALSPSKLQTIASSVTQYSETGAAPGISDDGQVVVFYGNLTDAGATALNAKQTGAKYPDGSLITLPTLAAGPGIFASVALDSAKLPDNSALKRAVIRIASVDSAQTPSLVHDFTGLTDYRVAVNATQSTRKTVSILFFGHDGLNNGALFSSQVNFVKSGTTFNAARPGRFVVTDPVIVLKTSDAIPGLTGTVSSFNTNDPINNLGRGDIALSVTMTGGAAIVRLHPNLLYGVNIGAAPKDWNGLTTGFKSDTAGIPPQFAILYSWQGRKQITARDIVPKLPTGLPLAGFCRLSYSNPNQTGDRQVTAALAAFGPTLSSLSFMTIAVERLSDETYAAEDAPARVQRIQEAVDAVLTAGLQPVIFTNRTDWNTITGKSFAFSSVPLWLKSGDEFDELSVPDLTKTGNAFGGWTDASVVGKQYRLDRTFPSNASNFTADLNVFQPSLFQAPSNATPVQRFGKMTFVVTPISRANGHITLDVAATNEGTIDAIGWTVTSATLGEATAPGPFPARQDVPVWDTRHVTLTFPDTAGAPGKKVLLTMKYQYKDKRPTLYTGVVLP